MVKCKKCGQEIEFKDTGKVRADGSKIWIPMDNLSLDIPHQCRGRSRPQTPAESLDMQHKGTTPAKLQHRVTRVWMEYGESREMPDGTWRKQSLGTEIQCTATGTFEGLADHLRDNLKRKVEEWFEED